MKIFLIISILLLSNSCIYMINKGEQKMHFEDMDDSESNNKSQSTRVIIDGIDLGSLPVTKKISRCSDHDIIFEKEGHKDLYYRLSRNASFFLAFSSSFLTGSIGMAIDNNLCALDSFKDSKVLISLDKK